MKNQEKVASIRNELLKKYIFIKFLRNLQFMANFRDKRNYFRSISSSIWSI